MLFVIVAGPCPKLAMRLAGRRAPDTVLFVIVIGPDFEVAMPLQPQLGVPQAFLDRVLLVVAIASVRCRQRRTRTPGTTRCS